MAWASRAAHAGRGEGRGYLQRVGQPKQYKLEDDGGNVVVFGVEEQPKHPAQRCPHQTQQVEKCPV